MRPLQAWRRKSPARALNRDCQAWGGTWGPGTLPSPAEDVKGSSLTHLNRHPALYKEAVRVSAPSCQPAWPVFTSQKGGAEVTLQLHIGFKFVFL